jgi:cathepsin D
MQASTPSVGPMHCPRPRVSDRPAACNTEVTVALNFGGKTWSISPEDMNLGTPPDAPQGQCLGGIFDLGQGTSIQGGGGNPSWVVGDTFLKNVYSVFRADPPAVGFASLAGNVQASASGSPVSVGVSATGSGTPTGTGSPVGTTSLGAPAGTASDPFKNGTPTFAFSGATGASSQTATVGSGSSSGSGSTSGAMAAVPGVLAASVFALAGALAIVF